MDTTIVNLLARGVVLGFSIAAPVGPIGILCIRRTLAAGRAAGLVSGLGAATADAVYGSIAAFGLTAISGLLVSQRVWLQTLGGLFLCYLGVRTCVTPPVKRSTAAQEGSLGRNYFSTFLLTITNPMTILAFAGIFAGLGLIEASRTYLEAGMLVIGVFIGSVLWWFLLSGAVSLVQHRLGERAMRWVNRTTGIVILGFGVLALARLWG